METGRHGNECVVDLRKYKSPVDVLWPSFKTSLGTSMVSVRAHSDGVSAKEIYVLEVTSLSDTRKQEIWKTPTIHCVIYRHVKKTHSCEVNSCNGWTPRWVRPGPRKQPQIIQKKLPKTSKTNGSKSFEDRNHWAGYDEVAVRPGLLLEQS